MTSGLSTLLRLVSVTICLIVAASFVAFAVDQTSTASGHQQEILNPKAPAASTQRGTAGTATPAQPAEGGFRKQLDEVSEALTSPVSGLASSSSEWGSRTLRLIFALLFYGFALGYLARVLRVRA
jgi:predicted PurR-regulated permease PerM